ncbi:MAG: hypothetical protein ACI9ES_001534, partial [Oceanospirillaceae bacterium]
LLPKCIYSIHGVIRGYIVFWRPKWMLWEVKKGDLVR